MIINQIDFKIIVNKKKIIRTYLKVKYIDNQFYLIINSYKKLKNTEIEDLVLKFSNRITKIADKLKNDSILQNKYTLLGEEIAKEELTETRIKEAVNKITQLFNEYKLIFNRPNTVLKFRKMKTRWGVCYLKKDTISLTTPLIYIPISLTEYVIIHEFCHFKYPNHSKKFYDYVKIYCPDYLERKK